MTKNKKYTVQITQVDSSWTAEIIRQVTSKKTVVSKSQEGLSSEAEAIVWSEAQLAIFVETLKEKNKRHSA